MRRESQFAKLERLESLRRAGALDDQEFTRLKEEILHKKSGLAALTLPIAGVILAMVIVIAVLSVGIHPHERKVSGDAKPKTFTMPASSKPSGLISKSEVTGKWFYRCDGSSFWRDFKDDGSYATSSKTTARWQLDGNVIRFSELSKDHYEDKVLAVTRGKNGLIFNNSDEMKKCQTFDTSNTDPDNFIDPGVPGVEAMPSLPTFVTATISCDTSGTSVSPLVCLTDGEYGLSGALKVDSNGNSKSYSAIDIPDLQRSGWVITVPASDFEVYASNMKDYSRVTVTIADGSKVLLSRSASGRGESASVRDENLRNK